MAENDKTHFILRKRHLPARELAALTGLSEEEVARILVGVQSPALPPSPSRFPWGGRAAFWTYALLSALLVICAYLPVFQNDFVNWDDKDGIVENFHIRSLDWTFIKWMFTTFDTGNWMPLTWLSFALNYQMGGLNPLVFHFTNVFLHAANSILVFLVCRKLMRSLPSGPGEGAKALALPAAFLAALFFGLHPVHVESVAWAIERKDVLYSFFYLWSLLYYLDYAGSGAEGAKWKSLVLYALSLMSKPMAVTLPAVFLLLDIWPFQRLRKGLLELLKEKTFFFILAAGSTVITIVSHVQTMSYARSGLEFYWVLNAFRSLDFYLLKMACPYGLSGFYPFPQFTAGYVAQNAAVAVLVIVQSAVFIRYRVQAPYLLFGWLYYILTLAPALGIIQTGSQAAADRYTYLPSLGFFLPLAGVLVNRIAPDRIIYGLLTLMLSAGMGFMTVRQIGTWRNTQALWERVVKIYPDENADNYDRLGAAYLKAHRYDEALAAFSRAASIPPYDAHTYHGLGTALVFKDHIPQAIDAFEYALKLDPTFNAPHVNLWNVYERLGKHEEAIAQMKEALRLEPKSPVFYNDLGVSYGALKKYPEAQEAFRKAHELEPENSEYLVNLATICLWEGKREEALNWYRKGIQRNPREPVYFLKMGDIYLAKDLKEKARTCLQTAWNLHPRTSKVAREIGEDFQQLGETRLAQECFVKADELAGKEKSIGTQKPIYGMDLETSSNTQMTP